MFAATDSIVNPEEVRDFLIHMLRHQGHCLRRAPAQRGDLTNLPRRARLDTRRTCDDHANTNETEAAETRGLRGLYHIPYSAVSTQLALAACFSYGTQAMHSRHSRNLYASFAYMSHLLALAIIARDLCIIFLNDKATPFPSHPLSTYSRERGRRS